jgi:hypothetical protein
LVKDVWESLSGQSKPGKNIVLGTLCQMSPYDGHLGGYSGIDMGREVEDFLEESPRFSAGHCAPEWSVSNECNRKL